MGTKIEKAINKMIINDIIKKKIYEKNGLLIIIKKGIFLKSEISLFFLKTSQKRQFHHFFLLKKEFFLNYFAFLD